MSLKNTLKRICGLKAIQASFNNQIMEPEPSKREAEERDAAEITKRTQEAFDRWRATQKSETHEELPPFIIVHILRHGSV
jgi:hypothetical protein